MLLLSFDKELFGSSGSFLLTVFIVETGDLNPSIKSLRMPHETGIRSPCHDLEVTRPVLLTGW